LISKRNRYNTVDKSRLETEGRGAMSNPTPSCLYSGNAAYIEDLYEEFLQNPAGVDVEWREYFEDLLRQAGGGTDIPHSRIRRTFLEAARKPRAVATAPGGAGPDHHKQVSVLQLINAHRFRGHQQALLDPLQQYERPPVPELAPAYDLLSTAVYPDLSSKMAMKIGGKYKPDEVFLRHWHKLVPETAAAKHNLEKQMQGTAKACLEKAKTLKSDLAKDGIQSKVFDDILSVIGKRSERLTDGF